MRFEIDKQILLRLHPDVCLQPSLERCCGCSTVCIMCAGGQKLVRRELSHTQMARKMKGLSNHDQDARQRRRLKRDRRVAQGMKDSEETRQYEPKIFILKRPKNKDANKFWLTVLRIDFLAGGGGGGGGRAACCAWTMSRLSLTRM